MRGTKRSSWLRAALLGALASGGGACLPGNPAEERDETTGTTGAEVSGSATATTTGPTTGMLGCASPPCILLLVAQTLDDRVEVFAPSEQDPFRGSIELDLKPGTAVGDGSLDEPFGLAWGAEAVHVFVGHFPSRERGSVVSFPASFFADVGRGERVRVADFFDGVEFSEPVRQVALGFSEPIFVYPRTLEGRLLATAFNNDLFGDPASWTRPGVLLEIDPADSAAFGSTELDALDGGACQASAQLVPVSPGRLATGCDGNDGVAFLDWTADAGVEGGGFCPLPLAEDRRVRAVAPDGEGGVWVAASPAGLLDDGEIYRVGAQCRVEGPVVVGELGTADVRSIVAMPDRDDAWWVSSTSTIPGAARGVYVLRSTGSELRVCGPVPGLEGHVTSPLGDALGPTALAPSPSGDALAIGLAPVDPAAEDGIYGRVLWATVDAPDDPCDVALDVSDLTDGRAGAAAEVDPAEPATWRRAPDVAIVVEVGA